MEKMSFKTFTWPVNPEVFQEELVREPVYVKNSADVYVFSGMGPVKRMITGEGNFFGAQASEQYAALAALLEDATLGPLVHPVFGTRSAFFTGLEMTQKPRKDFVSYRFTFTGADEHGTIPK